MENWPMTHSASDSISVTDLEKKFGAFVAVDKITFLRERKVRFSVSWARTVLAEIHHNSRMFAE